ncbi:MAG: dephospho-CoA kinase [Lachnospiraceae bacterium]|nr:dephospho-CoA kinase [Lachnospiraceae bacterium]
MLFIGITGGVGAGKTAILSYIRDHYKSRILVADEIAHQQMEPGTLCYQTLADMFQTEDIFLPEGGFDRLKLAKVIFSDEEKRKRLNAVVHPAVHAYVMDQVAAERASGQIDVLILEAALLLEAGYADVCDEIWYIYTSKENRMKRLMDSRGYTKEKSESIMASQLSEAEFRKHCSVVIDNNGSHEESFLQIDQALLARGITK